MKPAVYPRVIARIQGQDITVVALNVVRFRGDVDIDADGSGGNAYTDSKGKVWKDRYFQAATSLRFRGKSLNSHTVPYAVVPPAVLVGVPGIVLGCLVWVTNRKNGKRVACVCGDTGPTAKVGEVSIEAARRLGVDPNPVIGGDEDFEFDYEVHAGIPAVIDGITYDLQAYRPAA
ncbi:MAG: hypothetical protein JWO82_2834 [Akkermansiaceae bacterium]|nr:hypothetical protein [Akkermansiaceae bacterium]